MTWLTTRVFCHDCLAYVTACCRTLQECVLESGDTCDVKATATVVFADGADDASGGSSARGVDSISNKENLQKVASSARVEASDVRHFFFITCS